MNNHLVAAIRRLARNKLHTWINVGGLALGFAAAILIALFVRHELTYDRFIPHREQVFRLAETYYRPAAPPLLVDATLPQLAALLKADFPQVEAVARLQNQRVALRAGHVENSERIEWADPDFFKVMPLPVLAGNPNAALARPDGVVLTSSMARKYFGDAAVLGKTLELDGQPMRVGAVIEDLPSNSHLDLQLLASGRASFSLLARFDREDTYTDSPLTYFRLRPGAAIGPLAAELPVFLSRHGIKQPANTGAPLLALRVTPLAGIHLQPAGLGAMKPSTSMTSLFALSAVATLIVLIATINYVNLMTAGAVKRSVEIGVRKAVGAPRRSLMVQFVGESMLGVHRCSRFAMEKGARRSAPFQVFSQSKNGSSISRRHSAGGHARCALGTCAVAGVHGPVWARRIHCGAAHSGNRRSQSAGSRLGQCDAPAVVGVFKAGAVGEFAGLAA
jgi:putative ABC transport system permease protein